MSIGGQGLVKVIVVVADVEDQKQLHETRPRGSIMKHDVDTAADMSDDDDNHSATTGSSSTGCGRKKWTPKFFYHFFSNRLGF